MTPIRSKRKKITVEEYWKIYYEREELLESMPGGSQGANPDMSDVECEEL